MNTNSFFKTPSVASVAVSLMLLAMVYMLAPVTSFSRQAQTAGEKRGREMRTTPPPRNAAPQPNPNLSPEQVVTVVLEALQHNDQPAPDSGISTAFRFASPDNRAVTGPLDRFIELVKNPLYKPLLSYKTATRGPVRIADSVARQRVTLTAANGAKAVYLFTLSKQTEDPYKNCWMTDGVERVFKEQDDNQQVAKSNGHAHTNPQS